jgi:hypothetical protein
LLTSSVVPSFNSVAVSYAQRNQGGAAAFARPSPDGRPLAIQDYRIEGNIWTLENF